MTRTLAIIALALLLAACGSHRRTTTPAGAPAAEIAAEAPAGATPAQLYAAMTATYSPWHSVQMPVRASLRTPMSISASGQLTMVHDSLVHLSLRMLGIELAVVSVDRDSVRVFDKFHRYYMAESTAALTGRTGISLADMQNLLLGRAFVPGSGAATPGAASQFKLAAAGDGALLMTPATPSPLYTMEMQARRLAGGHVALTTLQVTAGSRTATCGITPCTALSPFGALASAIDINARLGQRTIAATLTLTPDRAEWNTRPTVKLPSTRGYTRATLTTLLKSGF